MNKATLGTDNYLLFWCPGCDSAHGIPVDGSRGWTFSGDLAAPTVSPSILVRFTLYGPERLPFHRYEGAHPPSEVGQGVCHSFVRAGSIEFLDDCTHSLAGRTVPLPDWDSI